jgi:hypothetical protein
VHLKLKQIVLFINFHFWMCHACSRSTSLAKEPGSPALRTPATVSKHTCLSPSLASAITGLTWTQSPLTLPPLYLSGSPLQYYLSYVLVSPCADAVPVLLPVCSVLNVNSPYLPLISSVGPDRLSWRRESNISMYYFVDKLDIELCLVVTATKH